MRRQSHVAVTTRSRPAGSPQRRRGFDVHTIGLVVAVVLLLWYSLSYMDKELEKESKAKGTRTRQSRDEVLSRVREHITAKDLAKKQNEDLAEAQNRKRRRQESEGQVSDLQMMIMDASEILVTPQSGWTSSSRYKKGMPDPETTIRSFFSHQHFDALRYQLSTHQNIAIKQKYLYELDNIFDSLTTVGRFLTDVLPQHSGIQSSVGHTTYRPSPETCYNGFLNISMGDWFDSWCDYVFTNPETTQHIVRGLLNDVRGNGNVGLPILVGAIYDAILTLAASAESEGDRLDSCRTLQVSGANTLLDALVQLPGHKYDLVVIQNPPIDLHDKYAHYQSLHEVFSASALNLREYELFLRPGSPKSPAVLVNTKRALCTVPQDQPTTTSGIIVIGSTSQPDPELVVNFKLLAYSDMESSCEETLFESLPETPHRRVVLAYQSSLWYFKTDFVNKKIQWISAPNNNKASPLIGLGHGATRHTLQTSNELFSRDLTRVDWVSDVAVTKKELPISSPPLLNILASKKIPHLDVELDEVQEEEQQYQKKHSPYKCDPTLSLSTDTLRVCGSIDTRRNGTDRYGIVIEKRTAITSEPWIFVAVISGFQTGEMHNPIPHQFTSIQLGDNNDGITAISTDKVHNAQYIATVQYSGSTESGIAAFNITARGLFHNTVRHTYVHSSDLQAPAEGNTPLTELELMVFFDPEAGEYSSSMHDYRWDPPTPHEESHRSPALIASSRGFGMSIVTDLNLIKDQHRTQTWSVPHSLYMRSGAAARNSSSLITFPLDSLPATLNFGLRCLSLPSQKRLIYSPPPHTGSPLFRVFLFVGKDIGSEVTSHTSSFMWLRFGRRYQKATSPLPQVIPYGEYQKAAIGVRENQMDSIAFGIAKIFFGQSITTYKHAVEGMGVLKHKLWLIDDTSRHEEQHPGRDSSKPTICSYLSGRVKSLPKDFFKHIYQIFRLEVNPDILVSVDLSAFDGLILSEAQFTCILQFLQGSEFNFDPHAAALVTAYVMKHKPGDQELINTCMEFGHLAVNKYLFPGARKPAIVNQKSGSSSVDLTTMSAVSQLLMQLYRLTKLSTWLSSLSLAVAQVGLMQQVWTPPRLLCCRGNFFGGFSPDSQDPSWSNDNAAPVPTLADYYLMTGKAEFLERCIAAVRASWAFMEHPANRARNISFANEVPQGFYPTNMLRRGWDDPWYTNSFDLQGNEATYATSYILRSFGNVWIDFALRRVFAIDALEVGATWADNSCSITISNPQTQPIYLSSVRVKFGFEDHTSPASIFVNDIDLSNVGKERRATGIVVSLDGT